MTFSKNLHVKCGVPSQKLNEKVPKLHRELDEGHESTSNKLPVAPTRVTSSLWDMTTVSSSPRKSVLSRCRLKDVCPRRGTSKENAERHHSSTNRYSQYTVLTFKENSKNSPVTTSVCPVPLYRTLRMVVTTYVRGVYITDVSHQ